MRASYPEGTPNRNALERLLSLSEQRLVKLSAMKAPEMILANERKLVAQRKAWIEAWDKEHGPQPR